MKWIVIIVFTFAAIIVRGDWLEAEDAAQKFELPQGFTVRTIASEPEVQNPVAISMDQNGAFFVAETHRLSTAILDIREHTNWIAQDMAFRLVSQRERFLTNAFGADSWLLTSRSEAVKLLGFGEGRSALTVVTSTPVLAMTRTSSGMAGGVLTQGTNLFFACLPDLLRLSDPSGPDRAGKLLSSGYGIHIGAIGHDLHGPVIGMDGKLYFCVGDRGLSVRSLAGQLNSPDTGAVLRCNIEGTELEVIATGLRNPQDLAFDDLGNLWVVDEMPGEEHKCRVLHVIEGADFGWRTPYEYMKGFGPWSTDGLREGRVDGILPAAGEIGNSPRGLAYYPGTGLTSNYAGKFFLCEFNTGIRVFDLEPNRSSYRIKSEDKFLSNAHPTDIEFGSDGGVYFSDWVPGFELPNKGRIYRIIIPESEDDARIRSTAAILRGGFEDKDVATLMMWLEHPDLRVRRNAHLTLAKKKDAVPLLRELAIDTKKPKIARIHAIWALRIQGAIDAETIGKLVTDEEPEIRAQVAASVSMAKLVKLLKDENPRVRLYAAIAMRKRLLVEANPSLSSEAIIQFLAANNDSDPFLTHAGARALAFSSVASQAARKHPSKAVRRAAMLAARFGASLLIGQFFKDPELRIEAGRATYDVPIPLAYKDLAALVPTNCPPELLSRSICANLRIGGPDAAKRLALVATTPTIDAKERANALECLADWEQPSDLDRVLRIWRPVRPSISHGSEDLAVAALDPIWSQLFHDNNTQVIAAALNCARDLNVQSQATNVLTLVRSKDQPNGIRSRALATLAELAPEMFKKELPEALGDEALQQQALSSIPLKADVVAIVIKLTESTDPSIARAAFSALAKIDSSEATEELKAALSRIGEGKIPPELIVDVLNAAEMKDALREGVETVKKTLFSKGSFELFTKGGNAAQGKRAFEKARCFICHSVAGNRKLGPPLDALASQRSRPHLVESILQPNKAITPGYESILITLASGRQVYGVLLADKPRTIEVYVLEDGPVTIRKLDIQTVSRAQSPMPEYFASTLSYLELRDLVEYLASLN